VRYVKGSLIRFHSYTNTIIFDMNILGIVSNRGQHPCPSEEQESFLGIGPMCRFAADLLPTLRIIAGRNVDRLQLDIKVDSHSLYSSVAFKL
jgi:fatty acid amide hydrolase 2